MTPEEMNAIADMMVEKLIEKGIFPAVLPFKDVMNTQEVAKYLGITPGRVRHLVCSGDIPVHKNQAMTRNFFLKQEIDAWRANYRVKTNAEIRREIEAR